MYLKAKNLLHTIRFLALNTHFCLFRTSVNHLSPWDWKYHFFTLKDVDMPHLENDYICELRYNNFNMRKLLQT